MRCSAVILCICWCLAASAAGQTYCPDGSCGPGLGVGAGVQIGRIQIGAGAGVQRIGNRPRTESLASDLMVEVDGGLGVYLGGGMILTCSHGTKNTVRHAGREYPAIVLAEVATNQGDVAVLYCALHLPRAANVASTNPRPGTQVQWQGGHGVISGYSGQSMWIRGQCRFGDSGSPVWTRDAVVGVISGTTGDGEVVAASTAVVHTTILQARTALRARGGQVPRLDQGDQPDAPRGSLVDAGTEPISPPLDLSPITEQLARMAQQLDDLRSREALESDTDTRAPAAGEQVLGDVNSTPPVAADPQAVAVTDTPWKRDALRIALWAAGALGIGGSAVSGGWLVLAAGGLARRLWRARTGTRSPVADLPSPARDDTRLSSLQSALEQCRSERQRAVADADRLRRELESVRGEGSREEVELLRGQLEQARQKVSDLESRQRDLVIAYTDTYRQAVDRAEAELHKKDPLRWQQFLPQWRAMVEQFHSSVREEKRHASHSPVYQ